MQHKRQHAVAKWMPESSRTYLIRDENTNGQMSKLKTARFSSSLRQSGRDRRRKSPKRQRRENREGCQQSSSSSKRLDQPRISCCFVARCRLEGGTFWEAERNTTHEAWRGNLMKQPDSSRAQQLRSERLAHASGMANLQEDNFRLERESESAIFY